MIKLTLHRELNQVTCVCGVTTGYSHVCDTKSEGNVVIEQCDYSCEICTEEIERREYEERRWWKDRDGYTRCGECSEKCEDLCETCFCPECHEEKYWDSEKCRECSIHPEQSFRKEYDDYICEFCNEEFEDNFCANCFCVDCSLDSDRLVNDCECKNRD